MELEIDANFEGWSEKELKQQCSDAMDKVKAAAKTLQKKQLKTFVTKAKSAKLRCDTAASEADHDIKDAQKTIAHATKMYQDTMEPIFTMMLVGGLIFLGVSILVAVLCCICLKYKGDHEKEMGILPMDHHPELFETI